MQSQAFTHHFGPQASFQPAGKNLLYNTQQQAGTNPQGQSFTYADEYLWMGATARVQIFNLLNTVLNDSTLHLDMFAYDLTSPNLQILLKLAKGGRVRIILDNAALHTNKAKPTPEDYSSPLFFNNRERTRAISCAGRLAATPTTKFSSSRRNGSAAQVLTGSTNFSNGAVRNANHVLVFNDATVAQDPSVSGRAGRC